MFKRCHLFKVCIILETCVMFKTCSMDTTLLDFTEMKWERGDVTFLFNGSMKPSRSLIVLDNKLKVYQYVRYEVCML